MELLVSQVSNQFWAFKNGGLYIKMAVIPRNVLQFFL